MASQPQNTTTSSTPQGQNLGTDNATRGLVSSQSIYYNPDGYAIGEVLREPTGRISQLRRNPETNELYDATGLPPIQGGIGQLDDSGTKNTVELQQEINIGGQAANLNTTITPRPNVLDDYSSYTYSASIYMLSPDQYNAFTQVQQKKSLNGANLLFRSGGVSGTTTGPTVTVAGESATPDTNTQVVRNPYFTDDFYIDNIVIRNNLFGKATGAAHSVTSLQFSVIEPSNITLIERLYRAAQALKPSKASGTINYASVVYVMVLRFYGYDQNGKQVAVGNMDQQAGMTDKRSVVEKYIPFLVKTIKMNVGSKLVSYEWDCAPVAQLTAMYTRRGTIPSDVEVSGSTVGEMLSGSLKYSTARPSANAPGGITSWNPEDRESRRAADQINSSNSAPPKATPLVPSGTIRTGIVEAMNQKQKQLVADGIYQYADEYEIVFGKGAESIRDATVKKPEDQVAKDFTAPTTAIVQNPQALLPEKQRVDMTTRLMGITAGTQLLQAIELIIRNSNYITDQSELIFEQNWQCKPNPKAAGKNGGFRWFTIIPSVQQKEYDRERNDYAYKITYTIVPYIPQDFRSLFFPPPKYRGLHKSYPVWFTGKNTSVISYSAEFNNLYNLTVTGALAGNRNLLDEARKNLTSESIQVPFLVFQSRSTESSQGGENRTNEIGANAAEYFYNPSDNGETKIKIIGDPAWIQQGHVSGGVDPQAINYSPWNTDGGINFETMDVLFDIRWQNPEDYNLNTGLADPNRKTGTSFQDRQPKQNVLYRAKSVVSELRQGRFEQTIEGTLYLYPPGSAIGTNTATSANNPTQAADQEADSQTTRASDTTPSVRPSTPWSTNMIGTEFTSAGPGGFSMSNLIKDQFTAATGIQQGFSNNLRIPNFAPATVPGVQTGQFSSFGTTSADQINTASQPGPVTSSGVVVGSAQPTTAFQSNNISGDIINGAVVGAITVNGQVLTPGSPQYADTAYRLLESRQTAPKPDDQPQQSQLMSKEA